MDQQSYQSVIATDNHYMTREFLETKVAELTSELAAVKTFKEDLIVQSNRLHSKHDAMASALQSWTRDELKEDNITLEQAQALASIGNFKLTRNYDVTVVVEHSFSVELEADDDIDDVLASLDFVANSYHTTLDNEDYAVVESNYDETD